MNHEEAEKRQAQFIGIGLPSTFISDFAVLVDELSQAADVRLDSKTRRGNAQAGIAAAVARGLDVVHDLDVIVEVATSEDPVLAATWRVARRIEALHRPSSGTATAAPPVVASPEQSSADPPATTVAAPLLVLEKAS